jgi:NAD(P) transhydrogenase subunit alpha
MTIGVLKEGNGENRVVLLPEHVANLVKKEFTLLVEKGAAALAAHANDASYQESGAAIKSRTEVLKGC